MSEMPPTLKPASAALQAAVAAGNVNIGGGVGLEHLELSATSLEEQDKHAMLLRRVEAEKRSRSIVVPTNKDDVAAMLRSFGEPIRFFGENLADVRERLRMLLARMQMDGEDLSSLGLPQAGAAADGSGVLAGLDAPAARRVVHLPDGAGRGRS